jgi:hypothetical protein
MNEPSPKIPMIPIQPAIVIHGRYAGQGFIPEGYSPPVEGRVTLIIYPTSEVTEQELLKALGNPPLTPSSGEEVKDNVPEASCG